MQPHPWEGMKGTCMVQVASVLALLLLAQACQNTLNVVGKQFD